MANTPKTQIIRLAVGTAISSSAFIVLLLTSEIENSLLFYGLSVIAMLGITYAIPGYIGIWLWRMKSVMFNESSNKK